MFIGNSLKDVTVSQDNAQREDRAGRALSENYTTQYDVCRLKIAVCVMSDYVLTWHNATPYVFLVSYDHIMNFQACNERQNLAQLSQRGAGSLPPSYMRNFGTPS